MRSQLKSARHETATSNLSMISPDLLEMIWRRKWCLIGPVAIAMLLGAAYLTRIEPVYRIQARVLVQHQGLAVGEDRVAKDSEEFLATQAEIIRSPAVVERAVRSLKLASRTAADKDPVTAVMDELTVKPVLGTSVLSITLVAHDAEEGVDTVKAVIAAYRDYLYGIDHAAHLESLRVLTRSERELRQDRNLLEQQYLTLRKNSALMGQGKDAASIQKTLLTHLGQRLADARDRRLEMENRMQVWLIPRGLTVTTRPASESDLLAVSFSPLSTNARSSRPRVIDELGNVAPSIGVESTQESIGIMQVASQNAGEIESLRRELFRAEAKQRALAQQFGHKHPEMRSANEAIAVWRQRLNEAVEAAPAIFQRELEAAELHERQLSQLYQLEFEKAKANDIHLIEQQQVVDSIQGVQSLHDSILGQVRQWQLADQALAEGRTGVKVSTLQSPTTSDRIMLPPPALLFAACIVVGLIGGAATITILENTDTKVKSTQQVQNQLDHPVIGHIPVISAPRRGVSKPIYRSRLVRRYPDSSIAEAFRALRTRLAIDSNGGGGQLIQLASSKQGEGKTTVAANLAFSFAQLGKKVLLIDADLRKGALHDVFDVTNSVGLTSVLQGTVSLKDAVKRSPLAAVDVLARGPDVGHPVELLAQPEFDALLSEVRREYDLVLLDSSPLLEVTEPSVLAPKADGVLLSMVFGRSSLVEARRSCELLDTLNAKTLGIVMNQIPSNKRNGSYYEYRSNGTAAEATATQS